MNKLMPDHVCSVEVQFSGKTAVYHYLTTQHQFELLNAGMNEPNSQGDVRVVTPGKVSGDRLSTSVATVIGIAEPAHPSAVLPIVAVIMPHEVRRAKDAVEAQEVSA